MADRLYRVVITALVRDHNVASARAFVDDLPFEVVSAEIYDYESCTDDLVANRQDYGSWQDLENK